MSDFEKFQLIVVRAIEAYLYTILPLISQLVEFYRLPPKTISYSLSGGIFCEPATIVSIICFLHYMFL